MTWLFLQSFLILRIQDIRLSLLNRRVETTVLSNSDLNENQMRTIFYNSSGQGDGIDGNVELINQAFILQGGYDGSLVKQFVNGTEFTGGLVNNGMGTIAGASVSKIGEGLNGHIAEIIALDKWTPSAPAKKLRVSLTNGDLPGICPATIRINLVTLSQRVALLYHRYSIQ